MEFCADYILNNAGFHPAFRIVYNRKADAEVFVNGDVPSALRVVEAAAEACQKHHRKFKSFGFMNRHDADCVIAFCCDFYLPHGDFALLYSVDVLHEAVKRAALRLAVCQSLVGKRTQVCLTLTARRHCAHRNIKSGVQHELPDQFFKRQHPRVPAPVIELLQGLQTLSFQLFVSSIFSVVDKRVMVGAGLFASSLRSRNDRRRGR